MVFIQDPSFRFLSCDPCTRQDTICSSESLQSEWRPLYCNKVGSNWDSLKWKGTYL